MNDFEKAQSGITPTYMGNTLALAGVTVWLEDHPHIHGEYLPFALNVYRLPGSPPHTWGIQTRNNYNLKPLRITPTYMGNTFHH